MTHENIYRLRRPAAVPVIGDDDLNITGPDNSICNNLFSLYGSQQPRKLSRKLPLQRTGVSILWVIGWQCKKVRKERKLFLKYLQRRSASRYEQFAIEFQQGAYEGDTARGMPQAPVHG